MSNVISQISVSLDGFVAGPNQSLENPIGEANTVPIALGAGERLPDNVGDPALEPVGVVPSPVVTHVRYRIARA